MNKKFYLEVRSLKILGTISYKDTETNETSQQIQSVETTASIVTENFQSEEKILPQDLNPQGAI